MRNDDWIQYTAPLENKDLTGNRFWDTPKVELNRIQGNVFVGLQGDETIPLELATVSLYGSNSAGVQGDLLGSTLTNSDGWFGLIAPAGYEYYSIVETNLPGYLSEAASSTGGVVQSADWIQYAAPLEAKDLTGNRFWDRLNRIEGAVFEGLQGDETAPLEGVTVSLYGSNSAGVQGELLGSTLTQLDGRFTLDVPAGYEYYSIVETNPPGYRSEAAVSLDGTVLTEDWIQYAAPLENKDLTGNRFWDRLNRIEGVVFDGLQGDELTPMEGVTVSLYGSNSAGVQGELLGSTLTQPDGRFTLDVPAGYEYYSILETNPPGYRSVAASSPMRGGVERRLDPVRRPT